MDCRGEGQAVCALERGAAQQGRVDQLGPGSVHPRHEHVPAALERGLVGTWGRWKAAIRRSA